MSAASRSWSGLRRAGERGLGKVGVAFFLVACVFTYYGQLNRLQTHDVVGTVYTALALVQRHTIWLDAYLRDIQAHVGVYTYMLARGPGGHTVTATPSASSLLAVPVVALFHAAGVGGSDWGGMMEASLLTAALTAAATVAVLFTALTRLTTRRRAALVAGTIAWGTLVWGVDGQALWQHGGAALALSVALLALIDRRLLLAGVALAAMVAFRPTTPVIALFLLPLVGRRARDWGRFVLGIVPFALPLAVYNWVAFGSPLRQGYGTGHVVASLRPDWGRILQATPTLLLSPGRGLFVYSPVLLFAVAGAILGRRVPLYRWCALAALAYVVVIANGSVWYGGESFGPRKITEILPLLAVLLVPAVDAVVGTRWLWLYVALLATSVFVEVLGASAAPASVWFDGNPDVNRFSTWWSPTNNEIEAMLHTHVAARIGWTVAILACALLFGWLTSTTVSRVRGLGRAAGESPEGRTAAADR